MKTVNVLKLGIECRDKATGFKGTLTHWLLDMGGGLEYIFQPRGLDEEGQPVKRLGLCLERLVVKEDDFERVDVPFEILGTEVTDKASGFTGMAVRFVRHVNGCFHVEIQPAGTMQNKGNTPIRSNEFDLRGCIGKMVPTLSESKRKESQARTPSPQRLPARKLVGESNGLPSRIRER